MKHLVLLLITFMAATAIWNLSSCSANGVSETEAADWAEVEAPAEADTCVTEEAAVEEEPVEEEPVEEDLSESDYEEDSNDDSYSESSRASSANTWTGASSKEELRGKLDGTYWHSDPNATKKDRLFIYEFHFFNGKVSMKTYTNAKANMRATDKKWIEDDDEFIYPSYEINYHSRGNFLSVDFGQDENLELHYRSFSIAFMENCKIATLFQFGDPDGLLKFGRFNPNN